tara:strand:- start:107 stop:508 length:402 start_codon:yes stop_codon:yes gene_type:complete
MDKDIDIFCEKILPYLDKYKNNLNYVISLLIREIRTNDLIYLYSIRKWYEYNLYENKWEEYDFTIIINQINTFDNFFENQLYNFLKKSKLNQNNKNYLLNLNRNIIEFIKEKNYNKTIIYENCCTLFCINDSI